MFDRLGLGKEVRALSGTWDVAGLRRADGRYLVHFTAREFAARMGEPTAGVHRGELQALLLRNLPAGAVHTGRRCTSINATGATPSVRLDDGEVVSGRAIVGADGQRSSTRTALFGDRPLHDCRYVTWRGTARPSPGTDWHAFAGETWGPRERFGILPISDDRVTWYAAARAYDRGGDRSELIERFAGWHHPIPALVRATEEAEIWRDHVYDRAPLRRWSAGAVTLLGDAAHPMTPELGQGACQAILDAWVVAEELSTTPDIPSAFRAYERRRRWRASLMTLIARAMAIGGNQEGRTARAIRERIMTLTPASVMLRQLELVTRR